MPPSPPPVNPIPLVVDLDGTLIKTDLLWESLARLLRRNPFWLFPVLLWWTRGRAFLKKQLAARVQIDAATLPYNEPFLKFLREQRSAGRKLILATASDLQMAKPVAEHTGLFDEVLGSDGKTNLRSGNKLAALVKRFGERGFDYAGNSSADLAVWRGAREAIVVNASHALVNEAANCTKPGPTFTDNYSPLLQAKSFLNELFVRSRYLAAIGAGLVLASAFTKPGIVGSAWIAPALILACAYGKNCGDSFRIGCVAGFSFWLASLYWLLLMPATGYPILGWVALSGYLALYPAAWTWMTGFLDGWIIGKPHQSINPSIHQSWLGRLLWSLISAAAWVALEMIRARLFGGFPWNFLGASQYQIVPLIQIASVTGVYGVSFLVVWVSLSFYSAVRMIFQRPATRLVWQAEIFLPLTVVIVLFAFNLAQTLVENPPAKTLRITLIQPSVPQTMIWDEKENAERLRQLLQISENALTQPSAALSPAEPRSGIDGERDGMRDATDLLIWPESAVPEFDDASYIAITNLIRTHGVWVIFNADDAVPRPGATNEYDNDVFNAAFLFNPEGGWGATYHKQKLVIFGEYIPLVRWLPFVKWFTPITGGFSAGNEPVQFEINRLSEGSSEPVIELNGGSTGASPHQAVNSSPLICYEDMFPQVARGAVRDDTDFLVNLTNDGWFGRSAEQWQHMGGAVFRAVENGVPLVRCCNNGVTCWIDAHGRVREILRDKTGSVYGEGTLTIDLPLKNHLPTFYNRHGDWFGWGCVGVTLLALVRKRLEK